MATVTEKAFSSGNDFWSITWTKDTTSGCYTRYDVTMTSGKLTLTITVSGQPPQTKVFTTSGQLIMPNLLYLLATSRVDPSWVP